mgnify:CR=1 FL=1
MKNASLNSHLKSIAFLFILTALFGYSLDSYAIIQQENSNQEQSYTEYKGKVLDSNTNKPLVFADVTLVSTNIGTITNKEGNFSLKIPKQHLNKNVSISYLGYETKVLPLTSFDDKTLKILLKQVTTELDIVNLNAPKNAKTSTGTCFEIIFSFKKILAKIIIINGLNCLMLIASVTVIVVRV